VGMISSRCVTKCGRRGGARGVLRQPKKRFTAHMTAQNTCRKPIGRFINVWALSIYHLWAGSRCLSATVSLGRHEYWLQFSCSCSHVCYFFCRHLEKTQLPGRTGRCLLLCSIMWRY
jgi:hypothetical protein